jgi:hypothetical protein
LRLLEKGLLPNKFHGSGTGDSGRHQVANAIQRVQIRSKIFLSSSLRSSDRFNNVRAGDEGARRNLPVSRWKEKISDRDFREIGKAFRNRFDAIGPDRLSGGQAWRNFK